MICHSLDLVIFPLEVPQHLVDLQHEIMKVCPLHLEFWWRCLDEYIHEHLQVGISRLNIPGNQRLNAGQSSFFVF